MYNYLYKILKDTEVKYTEKSSLNNYFNEESDNFI